MAAPRILIVDDDQSLLDSLSEWLTEQGFEVWCAGSAEAAKSIISASDLDVCLIDICLDGDDGFSILRWCNQRSAPAAVLLMTGYGSPDTAVEGMREGAFDLLTKPIIDEELMAALRRAIDHKRMESDNARLKTELRRQAGMHNIRSHDLKMQRIFDMIESVADTRASILITGENGTGKSMIARAIHARSSRAAAPFVEVACGALPDNLLESELFGHKTGSFTGAIADKVGKFKQADSGTIFLDEIGTASPAMQIKLLRVLQELQFEPVGCNQTVTVDTRCILATNEDLEQAVQNGSFRQDLYYRINVIHLDLPPLRQRVNDIPLLIEHFLKKNCAEFGKQIDGFSREAMDALFSYNWPGNIRELENVVQRAVLLTKSATLDLDLLPPAVLSNLGELSTGVARLGQGQTLREALEGPERQIILEVLKANSFSRNLTANRLGINRTTLYKKMKRLGIDTSQLGE